MHTTRSRASVSPTAPLPLKVPMPQAPALFGLSKSAIYRAAKAGHVKLSKLGRGTLVDTASVRSYLDTLPDAKLASASIP